jgi:hypothetical protein
VVAPQGFTSAENKRLISEPFRDIPSCIRRKFASLGYFKNSARLSLNLFGSSRTWNARFRGSIPVKC